MSIITFLSVHPALKMFDILYLKKYGLKPTMLSAKYLNQLVLQVKLENETLEQGTDSTYSYQLRILFVLQSSSVMMKLYLLAGHVPVIYPTSVRILALLAARADSGHGSF